MSNTNIHYIRNAINLITNNDIVDVEDGVIKKVGFWKGVKISMNRKAQKAQIERIAAFSSGILEMTTRNDGVYNREASFRLAEAIVTKYAKSKHSSEIIRKLDLLIKSKQNELWPSIEIESKEFLHPSNQKNFTRWIKYGFSKKIFIEHPDFSNFLINTYIANAMATWGDQIHLENGHPCILLDGKYVRWEEVKESIDMKYHPESRTNRMYNRKDGQPLEYLGGGQGIVVCDRYHSEKIPVVTRISNDERNHILTLGRSYCRPESRKKGTESMDYVLQVVTTKKKCVKVQLSNLFEGPDHPYFRLISPNGDVKIIGFMKFNNSKNILKHGKGSVDAPDFGDLTSRGKQHITNIAISGKEVKKFEEIVMEIRGDNETTFNYCRQNCSSFVKHVLSEMKLAELPKPISIISIARDLLKNGRSSNVPLCERLIDTLSRDDTKQNRVARIANIVFNNFINTLIKPITIMIGDRPFRKFGDQQDKSANKASRLFQWLVEPFVIDFPGQIIAWQESIGNTEVVEKDKKIAISSFSPSKKAEKQAKIHTIPGFGTPLPKMEKNKRTTLATKVWNVTKNVFYYMSGFVVAHALLSKIRNSLYPGRYQTNLHPEMVRHNEQNAPRVGETVMTTACVINSTDKSYAMKLALLSNAKQSIEISFNFAGGQDFTNVLELFEKKLREQPELKIHFLVSEDLLKEDQVDKMKEIKKEFGNRFNYIVTTRYFLSKGEMRSEENHVKAIVVDGKYFVIGGTGIHDKMDREVCDEKMNDESFADRLIDRTFRDTDVAGRGELANTIRGQFFNLYQIWANRMNHKLCDEEGVYTPINRSKSGICPAFDHSNELIHKVPMKFLVGGPEHKAKNPITYAIVDQINKAKSTIQIANLYFNPASPIKKALMQKKKDGVATISAVLNGVGNKISSAHYNYLLTNHKNYHLVNEAHEYKCPDRLYHKKVLVVDDTTIVGSYNLGKKSAYSDNECVLVVEDIRFTRAIQAGITEDKENANVVKLSGGKINRRPLWTRALSPVYTLGGRIYG